MAQCDDLTNIRSNIITGTYGKNCYILQINRQKHGGVKYVELNGAQNRRMEKASLGCD